MSAMPWLQRFLHSTRGRLVALLRREEHTVEELAQALDLTDNAVRAHLAALERDDLVQQRGVRRGGGSGKPAYTYELTASAEQLFPKAYEPVLQNLLDLLGERMAPEETMALLQEAGRRMAAGHQVPSDDFKTRLGAAVRLLTDLGGLAEIEDRDGRVTIRGYACPLAGVVREHPNACQLTQALLTGVIGQPVQERCDRAMQPRCCFDMASM
jgi:predicted ArsR family transcriptional regulator